MRYKLIITDKAEQHLESILYYLVNSLKNPEAARKLLLAIERVYTNLEENPQIYAKSYDPFLLSRGYRKATVKNYDYVVIYRINERKGCVYILGIFHDLESYEDKMNE